MRKLMVSLLGLTLGLGTAAPVMANEAVEHEHGQVVEMSALPAPVKATFDKESKGGTLEEVRKDTLKDGRVVYRGEVIKKGKGTELEVGENGKVLHRGKAHDESKEKGEKSEQK